MSEVEYFLQALPNVPKAHSNKITSSQTLFSGFDRNFCTHHFNRTVQSKKFFIFSQISGGFRFSLLILALAGVFLTAAYQYYFRPVFFLNHEDLASLFGVGIEQVSLTGHHSTSDRDIFEVLQLEQVRSFLSLDPIAREERLKKLPWVKEANLKRIWPNQITISIKERKPFGIWQVDNKAYLIDDEGRTLGPLKTDVDLQLPRFSGEGATAHASEFWSLLQTYPQIRDKIKNAEFIDKRRWSLKLKQGGVIDLPTQSEAAALSLLASDLRFYTLLNESSCTLDLRFSDRIILRASQKDKSGACRTNVFDESKTK
ncbi:MAG: cell division protein FtsQ/DivIB [Hyphomicrobium sp.]